MSKSIFSKIIQGELACNKIYENEHVLAFLDLYPLTPGHTLVVPKQEVAFLHELSEASAQALGKALPKIALAVMTATGVRAYNILQNNEALAHQAVMHVHFHIIPRPSSMEGLGIIWKPIEASAQDLKRMADQISKQF